MMYDIFRDLVLLVHCAFVLFVVSGGLLAFRWPKILPWHFASVIWAVAVEWTGWFCPLTPLEIWLEEKAAKAGFPGGILGPYIFPVLYPSSVTRGMQIFLGAFVLFWNLLLYGLLFYRTVRKRNGKDGHD